MIKCCFKTTTKTSLHICKAQHNEFREALEVKEKALPQQQMWQNKNPEMHMDMPTNCQTAYNSCSIDSFGLFRQNLGMPETKHIVTKIQFQVCKWVSEFH